MRERTVTHIPALTVRSLRVRPVALTPDQPVQTAAGTITATCLVLIDLLTEEGVTGRSYLRCYSPLALAPLAALTGNLAELLAGQAVTPQALNDRMHGHFQLMGTPGLVGTAMPRALDGK